MRGIELVNVTKIYNGEVVLDNLNLSIPRSKFFALLGPSGCGKTTILRLIAGFEQVNSGQIFLGDRNITHTPITERQMINTVFQQYALFPHMNVFDNVAYSLTIRNVGKKTIERKVIKVLTVVRLEAQIYKPIQQLSGGQQQRVALARAIINEPEVLLLDEPLAALDLKLRERMLLELVDLQESLKTTFVYVTHDQLEALTIADQMAIMSQGGIIEQIGAPKQVYEFPATTFVAQFVGQTTIFEGILQAENDLLFCDIEGLGRLYVEIPEIKRAWVGKKVYISIRPEKIAITKGTYEGYPHHLVGVVEAMAYHGPSTLYRVRVKNGQKVHVFEQNKAHTSLERITYDDTVHLYWHPNDAVVLDR